MRSDLLLVMGYAGLSDVPEVVDAVATERCMHSKEPHTHHCVEIGKISKYSFFPFVLCMHVCCVGAWIGRLDQ